MDDTADYSLLIRNIEDHLASSDQAPSKAQAHDFRPPIAPSPPRRDIDFSISSILGQGSAKRPRLSELVLESHLEGDDDDLTFQTRGGSGIMGSISGTLRMQSKLDEMKLTNDMLKDQLASSKSEHELFKDQAARQLKFMEDSSKRYKSELDLVRQKYYDEKKKWQSKLREVEEAVKQANRRAESGYESARSVGHTVDPTAAQQHEKTVQRMHSLEETIRQTQAEAQRNLAAKLDLEAKVESLEQTIKSSTGHAQNHENDDTRLELRHLRQKVQEVESLHRRSSAEAEKLRQQLKNQRLLEQDLADTTTRLTLAQETIKSFASRERELVHLQEERKTWEEAFHGLVQLQSAERLTPSAVASTLRTLQQNYMLVQRQQGDTERSLQSTQQKLVQAEESAHALKAAFTQAQEKVQSLESARKATLKHKALLDSEVTTLRTLVQSFDHEFSLGRPDVAKMLAVKEELVTALRADLDTARHLVEELQKERLQDEVRIGSLEVAAARASSAAVTSASVSSSAASAEQERYTQLKADHRALQEFSGVDFLPHRTRILHFKMNPAAMALGTDASSTTLVASSHPVETVRRYRQQTRSLQQQLQQQQSQQQQTEVAPSLHSASQDSAAAPVTVSTATAAASSSSAMDPAKLNQRLKETFKEKINTFREAVYLLTGYKMELSSVDMGQGKTATRLKLRSMFAESSDDWLLFQMSENGPELLESEFATRMDGELLQYLQRVHSVPAFLSNVTLTLFENQTQMG